ncbi:MAG: UDP-3-O-(3-hydroxymyristoyl)glucosamine N-acyltransferase [Bacteroidales bacterium]|nr:UDP-3-O-(3-hydroxymyristoyl)glucosamine N-acyltransferase [Bacteroidales bacterium]
MKFPAPLKLSEIAAHTGATMVGDPDFMVTGINEIHVVETGDLTFVDHPKYYSKALNSKATTILINTHVDCPPGKALLICEKPFDAFVSLGRRFRPFEKAVAMVSPDAEIGEGTIIQPGTFVGNHVKIGKNCIIHANVSLYDHTVIGNNVIIHSGAVLGGDAYYFQRRPEGWKKFESFGRVIVEDNVEIGAATTIDKGVTGDTTISYGTKIDNSTQVGHDTYIGRHCLIGAHCAIAGVTRIEDDVILWGQVSINKDLVIGAKAIILATSAVDKTLEGGKTYFGIPAEEARKKWREMAAIRQLPDMVRERKSKEI